MENGEQKIVIYWSWKKTVSLAAAVLLVPTLFIWTFALTLKTTVINPNYYKGVLAATDTYDKLIQDGIPSLIVDTKVSQNDTTDWLAKEAVIFVVQKAIDPTWLQTITNKLIDQIVLFFDNEQKVGEKVELDLSQAESFLANANTTLSFVGEIIPSCGTTKADGTTVACEKIDNDEIKNDITVIGQNMSSLSLGMVDISDEVTEANSAVGFIQKFVKDVNGYLWVTTILAIVFIAAIVLASLKEYYYMTRFLAWPLGIASILTFIMVLIVSPVASGDYSSLSQNLPDAMNSIIADVLKGFTSGLFHRLEIIALIVLLIATVGYVTMVVLEKKIPALKRK